MYFNKSRGHGVITFPSNRASTLLFSVLIQTANVLRNYANERTNGRTDDLSVLATRINTDEINLEDVDIRAKSICGGLAFKY